VDALTARINNRKHNAIQVIALIILSTILTLTGLYMTVQLQQIIHNMNLIVNIVVMVFFLLLLRAGPEVIYFTFHTHYFKERLREYIPLVLGILFIFHGLYFILVENYMDEKKKEYAYQLLAREAMDYGLRIIQPVGLFLGIPIAGLGVLLILAGVYYLPRDGEVKPPTASNSGSDENGVK
jgi:hypothetical protein